jgi:uncharacterized protein YciI
VLFAMSAVDRIDAPGLRLATRPDHIEYLKGLGSRIAFAGPFLAADGKTPVGSPVIFEAENQVEAEALAAADPFCTAGLFATVTISPFRVTLQNLPLVPL